MPRVFVGVGSNINRDYHIKAGIKALEAVFEEIQCSPIYDTEAVGFKGDNFLNLVVSFQSLLSPKEIDAHLSAIEDTYQRVRSTNTKFCSRTLDLDLLMVGSEALQSENLNLPRQDVYHCAYVLKPLLDLDSELRDPVSGRLFSEIWQSLSADQKSEIQALVP